MKTFLFISECGDTAGIAKRIQDSSDRVLFYSNNPAFKHVGDGLVDKVDLPERLFFDSFFDPEIFKRLTKLNPDVVILDSAFDAAQAARLEFEKMGISVYGSSVLAKSSKNNPGYLLKIMKMSKLNTESFPSGCVPITYSIITNGKKFVAGSVYFESIKLMNDDLGPYAQMGSIGYHGLTPELNKRMDLIAEALIRLNFSGKIDLMLRLNKDDIWCEGVSFYFNKNTVYSFLENLNISASDFFYGCSLNQDLPIKFRSPWSCQISCSIPPFPYNLTNRDEINLNQLNGVNQNNSKHIWFGDLKKVEGKLIPLSIRGNIITVTGRGDYVREAKRRAYRTLSNLSMQDFMYRTDLGFETVNICRKLNRWGWLNIPEDELIEPFENNPKQLAASPSFH